MNQSQTAAPTAFTHVILVKDNDCNYVMPDARADLTLAQELMLMRADELLEELIAAAEDDGIEHTSSYEVVVADDAMSVSVNLKRLTAPAEGFQLAFLEIVRVSLG